MTSDKPPYPKPEPWHHWTPHLTPEGYEKVNVAVDAPRIPAMVTLLGCTACGSFVWNVPAHNVMCEYGKGSSEVTE